MFRGLQNKYKFHVQKKLEEAVVSYFQAHPEIKLVVVTGSVGKTSTKKAIATMLSKRYRVHLHEGNHNTEMSVPLSILNVPYPDNVKSMGEWQQALRRAKDRTIMPTDVDIIVQELGADHPGDIQSFGRYLRPYMSVVTGVTAEHMDNFKTIEAVAREELMAANFSQIAMINRDDIDGQYSEFLTNSNIDTYGTSSVAEYNLEPLNFTPDKGYMASFGAPELPSKIEANVKVFGEHNLRPAAAAAAVGVKFGLTGQDIKEGLEAIKPVAGRMNILKGLHGSTILDDTYNSSPASAAAAIQTFFSLEAPQRIAIMGSMNELGETSQAEHEKIGSMFTPDTVEWVLTVGEEAGRYLAPAARRNGCQVQSYNNAVQAGAFAHSVLQPNSVVLVKGSQNAVYTEEAIKILLLNQSDAHNLVRQSPAWMATKEEFFERNLV